MSDQVRDIIATAKHQPERLPDMADEVRALGRWAEWVTSLFAGAELERVYRFDGAESGWCVVLELDNGADVVDVVKMIVGDGSEA